MEPSVLLPLRLLAFGGPGQLSRYSDSLWAGRPGDRISVRARFSAHVQTGSGAQPASYTMGSGSLPGVNRPGRGVDHPSPSSADVKERAIPLLPHWTFVACYRVNFTLTFTFTLSFSAFFLASEARGLRGLSGNFPDISRKKFPVLP
jgi:hypothetical protein